MTEAVWQTLTYAGLAGVFLALPLAALATKDGTDETDDAGLGCVMGVLLMACLLLLAAAVTWAVLHVRVA